MTANGFGLGKGGEFQHKCLMNHQCVCGATFAQSLLVVVVFTKRGDWEGHKEHLTRRNQLRFIKGLTCSAWISETV
ncbi:MAG: hypothetical protein RIQ78_1160 [Bacteroidota bacterium]|jgi:5-deoxy-D-glucuronate isomerase